MVSHAIDSEDLPGVQYRAQRTFAWLLATSLGLLVLSVFIAAAYPVLHWKYMVSHGCEHDHLPTWKRFYAQKLEACFKLPTEAEVYSARQRHDATGETHEIRFRLPSTQRPEAWLEQIARASGLTRKDRETRFEYRGRSHWGSWLHYKPGEKIYSATVQVWAD
jgi:hypothetical protein